MKITTFKPHYEFEIRCPHCDLAFYSDTLALIEGRLETGQEDFNYCPHCEKKLEITEELKIAAAQSLPDKYFLWAGQVFTMIYEIEKFRVYYNGCDNDRQFIAVADGTVKYESESAVSIDGEVCEELISGHSDNGHVDWNEVTELIIEKWGKRYDE